MRISLLRSFAAYCLIVLLSHCLQIQGVNSVCAMYAPVNIVGKYKQLIAVGIAYFHKLANASTQSVKQRSKLISN